LVRLSGSTKPFVVGVYGGKEKLVDATDNMTKNAAAVWLAIPW